MTIVLYKWPEHGGLPSLTAAALQVEAYLRLAKVQFCVQECRSASSTPTGVLPALDTGSDVPAASEAGDLAAARAIIAALAKSGTADLDSWLSPAQRAEALAFTSLIAARLEPATQYTTWLERRGFREFRKAAYSGQLPFPLSFIVPWSQRSEMAKLLGHLDGYKAYQGALEALDAIADRLASPPSPGRYFFGPQPAALDALLFGHLAFYARSPIAAPVLRDKVAKLPVLCRYVDGLLSDAFASAMPPPPADEPGAWSDAAQGASGPPKHVPTVEELRMWRGSSQWLMGAGAAIGAFVLLGGHYVSIVPAGADGDGDVVEEVEVEEEDDDDGGDE